MLPASAEIIDNPIGTACGFALDIGPARFFFTPGVPRELKRMLEEQVIPRLLAGEVVTYPGECVELNGARIEDVLAREGGVRSRGRIPLYLAATGPRAVEYAGEAADGVLLNVCLPIAYVRERRQRLAAAARRADRAPSAIEVAMCVVVSPHEDARRGRDGAAST